MWIPSVSRKTKMRAEFGFSLEGCSLAEEARSLAYRLDTGGAQDGVIPIVPYYERIISNSAFAVKKKTHEFALFRLHLL